MIQRYGRRITYVRCIGLLLVPEILGFATLFLLFLAYGGHHHAHLLSNAACAAESTLSPTHPRVVLHITDIHVGERHLESNSEHPNLNRLIQEVLPIWAPVLDSVVVSGDLVHAITSNKRFRRFIGSYSRQNFSEWALIDSYLRRINESVPVIVAHGNHDSFGRLAEVDDALDAFPLVVPKSRPNKIGSAEASWAALHSRVRVQQSLDDDLLVCAVDARLEHPLHRPYNFFGDSTQAAIDLSFALDDHVYTPNVIAFGHYPTGVTKSGLKFREAYRGRVAAYLSGHLHTLYGLTPNGLEAMTDTGALELETPDLVKTGAYRFVVLDGGRVSTTVSFLDDQNSSGDLVVLSPPRAGLCSAGAGYSALASNKIRVLSPGTDLEELGVVAVVDGGEIGNFRRASECFNSVPCKHTYEAEWDAKAYEKGTHTLTIRHGSPENQGFYTTPYEFSLDGSPPKRWWSRLHYFAGASFALSEFDTMAQYLSTVALTLCIALSLWRPRSRGKQTILLRALAVGWLLGVPVLVSTRFVDDQLGLGWIGLGGASLPSFSSSAYVDIPFLFAQKIFWPVLVPVSFAQLVIECDHREMLESVQFRRVLWVFVALHAWRALRVTREMLGSYGLVAALWSPSCFPLFVITLLCGRRALRHTRKKRVVR